MKYIQALSFLVLLLVTPPAIHAAGSKTSTSTPKKERTKQKIFDLYNKVSKKTCYDMHTANQLTELLCDITAALSYNVHHRRHKNAHYGKSSKTKRKRRKHKDSPASPASAATQTHPQKTTERIETIKQVLRRSFNQLLTQTSISLATVSERIDTFVSSFGGQHDQSLPKRVVDYLESSVLKRRQFKNRTSSYALLVHVYDLTMKDLFPHIFTIDNELSSYSAQLNILQSSNKHHETRIEYASSSLLYSQQEKAQYLLDSYLVAETEQVARTRELLAQQVMLDQIDRLQLDEQTTTRLLKRLQTFEETLRCLAEELTEDDMSANAKSLSRIRLLSDELLAKLIEESHDELILELSTVDTELSLPDDENATSIDATEEELKVHQFNETFHGHASNRTDDAEQTATEEEVAAYQLNNNLHRHEKGNKDSAEKIEIEDLSDSESSESEENQRSFVLPLAAKGENGTKNQESGLLSISTGLGLGVIGTAVLVGTVVGIRRARAKKKDSNEVKKRALLELGLITDEQASTLSIDELELLAESSFEQTRSVR